MSEKELYIEIQEAVAFFHAQSTFNATVPNIVDIHGKRTIVERHKSLIRLKEWYIDKIKTFIEELDFDQKVMKALNETMTDFKLLGEKFDGTRHDHWKERQDLQFQMGYVYGEIQGLEHMCLKPDKVQEKSRYLKILNKYIDTLDENLK